MRATTRRPTARATDWKRHLTSTRTVSGGQICAKGTRIPVVVILDTLAEGATDEEILRSYPTLTRTHIRAAIAYAAALAREESLTPLLDHADQARRKSSRRAG